MGWSARRRGAVLAAVMAFTAVGFGGQSSAGGSGSRRAGDYTARALTADSRVEGSKSRTGNLAQSDPSLLGRTDATPVNVVVKLDYDATASYAGGIDGLAATSPRVTGKKLTGKSAAERAYESYTKGIDSKFRRDLAATVPGAKAGRSLQRVYGGVAVRLPANQVGKVLALQGVAAVQLDSLRQLQTDSSTTFIGAPTIWAQTGGQSLAGQGVIFGDLDSGVWPEHPSFADNPALGTPPAPAGGGSRTCNFGDNPLTPATDVFECNHKLIGGQPFIDTYNTYVGGEVYPDSARDSNGHGTHTTTTAAGGVVASTPIFGIDRGPISGVAPGAWVISYKVCGLLGCFSSDSAAAVEQAILDGVDVINFSISGGVNPYADPVELAFLDAYDAGILVAASAGNEGPAAATTNHLSPWTLTVAASTQSREFQSTLTLSDGVSSVNLVGASITSGVSTPAPVVLGSSLGSERCEAPLAAGVAAGKIVACRRGVNGRVEKGFNVLQGGAVGMILYNQPLQDIETDNHFLPTVHLADGTAFLAFMDTHTGVTATFTNSAPGTGQGDVMAAFSSRGPGGQFLKPDITAPGVQILAGHTPTPDEVAGGPEGQYFQAIAGTSMSAPHAAGSAILLKALHPDWSPGAIKSALMTTAKTSVVKEDLVTPADPFDFGAGRVDLTVAGSVGVVFDESALDMYVLGSNPLTAINVNTPSVNLPTMPGTITVTRTATNVSGKDFKFDVSTTAPAGSKITVKPDKGIIKKGKSQTFKITVASNAPTGQYFGEIRLVPKSGPTLHLPVAFFNKQGSMTLTQSCAAASIKQNASTTCTVTATNDSFGDADVQLTSQVGPELDITGAVGASVKGGKASATGTLAGKADATPVIDLWNLGTDDFLPLQSFDIDPIDVGDEEIANFDVPDFTFGGRTYSRVGIVSNGYVVLGGSDDAGDVSYEPQTLPDPARPNGLLAPYWSDLDSTVTGDAVRAAILSGGGLSWLVLQWDLHLWGYPTSDDPSDDGARSFQVWIGINGDEDVSYSYDANALADSPWGLTVGAENESGTGGAQISGAPVGSYIISTTPGAPGGSLSYTLTVKGKQVKPAVLTTTMVTDIVAGSTIVRTPIEVTKK
jgi:hypothetical protein